MKKLTTIVVVLAMTFTVFGQEEKESKKFTVDGSADFVSSYIWRGLRCGGASIQPALDISAYGITLGAWGSTDFSTLAKEIDFTLSYEIKGFSVSVTDYWWNGEEAAYFGKGKKCYLESGHLLEVGLAYTFPFEKFPLSLGVNTILLGYEDRNSDDKQLYSTYISASYPFSVKNVDCEIGVGVSPFEGMYSDKFHVASISAKASKSLQITEKFALPIFVELIFSPAQDRAYFVFGIRF